MKCQRAQIWEKFKKSNKKKSLFKREDQKYHLDINLPTFDLEIPEHKKTENGNYIDLNHSNFNLSYNELYKRKQNFKFLLKN